MLLLFFTCDLSVFLVQSCDSVDVIRTSVMSFDVSFSFSIYFGHQLTSLYSDLSLSGSFTIVYFRLLVLLRTLQSLKLEWHPSNFAVEKRLVRDASIALSSQFVLEFFVFQ